MTAGAGVTATDLAGSDVTVVRCPALTVVVGRRSGLFAAVDGRDPLPVFASGNFALPPGPTWVRRWYERATDNWRDIVDDPSIDIVSIVVGNALHLEMAEALARAGKHVLCEKPLTDTLESAEQMARLESEVDVVTN